jgi:hypothetical protein
MTKRQEILNDCPDEFKDTLTEWINGVEDDVNNIKDKLETINIGNLDDISDAFTLTGELSLELY